MLKEILRLIRQEGYISRSHISHTLDITPEMVDEGIDKLLQMGYLVKEETGNDCVSVCAKCPFAQSCGKQIISTFKIADKAETVE